MNICQFNMDAGIALKICFGLFLLIGTLTTPACCNIVKKCKPLDCLRQNIPTNMGKRISSDETIYDQDSYYNPYENDYQRLIAILRRLMGCRQDYSDYPGAKDVLCSRLNLKRLVEKTDNLLRQLRS